MSVFEQPVNPSSSPSSNLDHNNAIVSFEASSSSSLASAEDAELPEAQPNPTADCAGVGGLSQQLELLAKRQSLRIAVKAKGKIFFMSVADIMAVHAAANYASLKLRSGAYLLRESLCSIAVKLRPYGFVQIHRSVLVNASLVDEVWPLATGEYGLRIREGAEYVVTRRYKDNLRQLAYVWLGSERFCSSASVVTEGNS